MKGYNRVTKENIQVGMEVFTLPKSSPYTVVHISPNNREFCVMNMKHEYVVFFYREEVFCEGPILEEITALREEFKDRVEMIDLGRSFSERMYIATALVGVENTLNHLEDLADGTATTVLQTQCIQDLEVIGWDASERFFELFKKLIPQT
ncbi:MAG: hypothetical protein ACR2MS_07665 [Weeksellaceae bacterium]